VQVSFVIPLYNCLALTRACVDSLRRTVPPGLAHEIILVDDGSTDGTREWLQSLGPPFRVILNERNLGYAGANNRGAAAATGRLLVLLNSDLVLPPRWLEPMLAAHRHLGHRAGLVGNLQRDARTDAVDHSGLFINLQIKPEHDRTLPLRALLPHPWSVRKVAAVTGACVLVERVRYLELGGFDEGFRNGCEDVDLCLRARSRGWINAVALRSVVRHHVSASPGRKLNDERNTRRLALRWRDELCHLAARRWSVRYLQREWTGGTGRHYGDAVRALAHFLHLRRTPPPRALADARAALQIELDRWTELLGP